MKKITVIIPCYNDPQGLEVTLGSLSRQSLNKSLFEIIVSNDGANKEVERVCEKYKAVCINISTRRGVSFARNRAIERSSTEFLALIDADISCDEYWLENGIKLLERYDYVGGRVLVEISKNKKIHEYYRFLTAFNSEWSIKKGKFFGGCNIFLKKEIFKNLGYFEEKIIFGGEDIDFGKRVVASNNYSFIFSEDIIISHPSLSFYEILHKENIYRESLLFLKQLHPERFSNISDSYFRFFRILITPATKVLMSKRKLNLGKKFLVFCWSIFFGFLDALNYLKNRIANKKYYDFFNDIEK